MMPHEPQDRRVSEEAVTNGYSLTATHNTLTTPLYARYGTQVLAENIINKFCENT